MRTMYGVIRVERLSPPVASRLMVYATSALYIALAATDGASAKPLPPLRGALNDAPSFPPVSDRSGVDPAIVASVAERVALDSLLAEALPTTRAALGRVADSLIAVRMGAGVSAQQRTTSDSIGRAVGLAIVVWSRTDGFSATRGRPYVAPVGDSLWINDSPASNYATQNVSGASEFIALDNPANQQRSENVSDRGLILSRPKPASAKTLPAVNMSGASEPYWREVRPFALRTWNACPISAPPSYGVDSASTLYQNANAVVAAKRGLSAAQRTTALYWADNAGESGTPVGHWLAIASDMIGEQHLSAHDGIRLVLATAVAQADAFIAAWGYKYQFNLIRPRTYIRRHIDATWEPLLPTPPFPEFPSGHSTQSSAAATTITAMLGARAFTDSTSVAIGHAVRAFPSFEAAADEAGESRVLGGIHFPAGNLAGRALGKCIGDAVIARMQLTAVQ